MTTAEPLFGEDPVETDRPTVHEVCVKPFTGSENRPLIWEGFGMIDSQIRDAEIRGNIWLGGEFVESKQEPTSAMLLLDIERSQKLSAPQHQVVSFLRSAAPSEAFCDAFVLHKPVGNGPKSLVYSVIEEQIRKEFMIREDETMRGFAILDAQGL